MRDAWQTSLRCAQEFEAKQVVLRFDYKRPWEPEVRAVQTVTVQVR